MYYQKVALLENVNETFYESVSNVTIAISQAFVKYVDLTEKCINQIKFLKTLDLARWRERQNEEKHARIEPDLVMISSNNQNGSSKNPIEKKSNLNSSNEIKRNDTQISNYFLILSNLPKDVTRVEIIRLSRDIHKLNINHEVDKDGVLLNT